MRGNEWFRAIHKRLLEGDPVAPAELAQEIWAALLQLLRKRHPRLAGTDFLDDSVSDALISYIKRPSQLDPGKRWASVDCSGFW